MVADVVRIGLTGPGAMSNRIDGTRILVIEEQVEVLGLGPVSCGETILVPVRVASHGTYTTEIVTNKIFCRNEGGR